MPKSPAGPAKKSSAKPKLSIKLKGAPSAAEAPVVIAKKGKAPAPKEPAAAKLKKTSKAKPVPSEISASGIVHLAKDAADTVSKLASDILADRIVPTIEQIKAVAAHALDRKGKSKPKTKAKAAKKK